MILKVTLLEVSILRTMNTRICEIRTKNIDFKSKYHFFLFFSKRSPKLIYTFQVTQNNILQSKKSLDTILNRSELTTKHFEKNTFFRIFGKFWSVIFPFVFLIPMKNVNKMTNLNLKFKNTTTQNFFEISNTIIGNQTCHF